MTDRIDGWAREFLARPRLFATLSTIAPGGAPHQAVVWYTLTDEAIVVNSAVGRAWPTNLLRDPRCSIVVEDAYEWVGIRAEAEAITDEATAQADIAAMARRYHHDDAARIGRLIARFEAQQRISFRLDPVSIYEHPDE